METNTSITDLIVNSFAAEEAVKKSQIAYEQTLADIVKVNGSSTFCFEGKWYQIRSRKSEEEGRVINYLCKLKAEPRTWLTGRPKKLSTETDAVEFNNATFDASSNTTVIE
jgi:hypothetical protein